eukprot:763929-Hanusia_phi.AAC.5
MSFDRHHTEQRHFLFVHNCRYFYPLHFSSNNGFGYTACGIEKVLPMLPEAADKNNTLKIENRS